MTHLPADGRQGDAPEWPLPKASVREVVLWERAWHTPQAVMWERRRWPEVVARWVRLLAKSERPRCPLGVLAEVRQMEDRLGLTDMAMARLRWEIIDEQIGEDVVAPAGVLDIRERLQAAE